MGERRFLVKEIADIVGILSGAEKRILGQGHEMTTQLALPPDGDGGPHQLRIIIHITPGGEAPPPDEPGGEE